MAFHFKEFVAEDSDCAMKIGTDSVILGAWADLQNDKLILDIGTGCGLLALMAAQRSNALVYAVEIDKPAYRQAVENFNNSSWSDRLACLNVDFAEYAAICRKKFDHLISNPPYFVQSLKSPVKSRTMARHDDELPLDMLMSCSSQLLNNNGKLSVIMPYSNREIILASAKEYNLWPWRICAISGIEGKAPLRIAIEFRKVHQNDMVEEHLNIRAIDHEYSKDYIELTRDFYLGF